MAGELAEQEEIVMADPKQEGEESVTGANLREEQDATEPQADGSGEKAEAVAAGMPVDGRISGPPPMEETAVDSPAGDAALQSEERSALEGNED